MESEPNFSSSSPDFYKVFKVSDYFKVKRVLVGGGWEVLYSWRKSISFFLHKMFIFL